MKKTFSIILAAAMVLGMLSVIPMTGFATGASAPEGTAVNNEAEFLAMAADGKYYLAADITLTKTYEQTFKGTFDGNGKTVTISAPIFGTVENATIKNFNVKGEINVAAATAWVDKNKNNFIAAVAVFANGKSSFTDITSEVGFTVAKGAKTRPAAIAAWSSEGAEITITRCVNKGNMEMDNYGGGIYGWTDKSITITFNECINYGNIKSSGGYVGGIACRVSGKTGTATFTKCENYGNVTGKTQLGGIMSYGSGNVTMTDCYNKGIISDTGVDTAAAGGMLGKNSGDGTNYIFTNCINDGDIEVENQAGGIVGWSQNNQVTITNCVNNGNIQTANYGAGIIGRSGNDGADKTKALAKLTACLNTGNVASDAGQSGGMTGYLCGGVVIDKCINKGSISNLVGVSGGIYGSGDSNNTASTVPQVSMKITNCINYGKISGHTDVGGIVGRPSTKAPGEAYTVENCINYGDILNVANNNYASNLRTGGILGYSWGNNTSYVKNCINYGKITVDATGCTSKATVLTGGILGYVNGGSYKGINNANFGTITVSGKSTVIVGTVFNKGATANKDTILAGNYSIAIEGAEVAGYGNYEAGPIKGIGTVVTTDDVKSGELVALMNAAAKADNASLEKDLFVVKGGRIALPCNDDFAVVDGVCAYCGPYTGDTSSTALTVSIAMMFVSFVGIVGVAVYFNRKKKIAE